MNAIRVFAERMGLGREHREGRAEGTTRRANRQFLPVVDSLGLRIAPAVMIIPAYEPPPDQPTNYH